MRLTSALLAALLLALAFPLSLPPLPLPAPYMPLQIIFPGNIPGAGYAQLSWLAFVALIPLFEIARSSRRGGEAFGFGYLAGLLWLLMHWAWLGSFGLFPVVMLAGFFALPVGLFTLAVRWLLQRGDPALLLWGAPAVWTGVEYLRGFGFWAFPWNLLGYSQVRNLPLLQVADLGGIYVVSFLCVLANAAIFLVLAPVGPLRPRLGQAFAAAALLLAALAYGETRLALPLPDNQVSSDGKPASNPPLEMALVQGDVETYQRWSEDRVRLSLSHYLPPTREAIGAWRADQGDRGERAVPAEPPAVGPFVPPAVGPFNIPPATTGSTDILSVSAEKEDGQAVRPTGGAAEHSDLLAVWPEAVLQRSIDPRRPERLPAEVRAALAGRGSVALLMGAIGRPRSDAQQENGVLLVTPSGALHWAYSKIRVVPYGEVVPLRAIVRFLQYPWGEDDVTAGRTVRPLRWRSHCLGLGVCFDNVFSFLWRRQVLDGAQSLVLVTNNSWYKLHSGIRQHCDMDIARAVEYRRPLARCSTTGWSHFVDPCGRVLATTNVESSGMLRRGIGEAAGATPYIVLGDLFAQLCLLAALLACGALVLTGKSEGML